jgi:hypothetical protein
MRASWRTRRGDSPRSARPLRRVSFNEPCWDRGAPRTLMPVASGVQGTSPLGAASPRRPASVTRRGNGVHLRNWVPKLWGHPGIEEEVPGARGQLPLPQLAPGPAAQTASGSGLLAERATSCWLLARSLFDRRSSAHERQVSLSEQHCPPGAGRRHSLDGSGDPWFISPGVRLAGVESGGEMAGKSWVEGGAAVSATRASLAGGIFAIFQGGQSLRDNSGLMGGRGRFFAEIDASQFIIHP